MPSANQRISEYVLEERLGGGAFGEVWRARHHVWADRLVAVKIPTNASYIHNLQREGRALHGMEHPNIVRALGFDPYADPPYLVMEYVPGTSLRPLIRSRSLSIDQSVAVLQQVLRALAYAHSQGVVHRDMKPENILIHQRASVEGYGTPGLVKVTDFGLGKAVNIAHAESIALSMSADESQAREISGTLDYMAPEQRSGEEVDGRADLYACGVILHELVTGERPAGTDCPSDLRKDCPKYIDEAFRKAYCRLEKRFRSAEEFAAALSGATPPPLPSGAAVRTTGPTADRRQCPSCKRAVGLQDQFCMHCGLQLVEWVLRCPQCGAYPDPADRYCLFCGAVVGSQRGD